MKAILLVVLATATASAQREPPKPPTHHKCKQAGDKPPCEQDIDVGDGLRIGGKLRNPQLLDFLERAREELERSSLERRSFIPHILRSLDDEQL